MSKPDGTVENESDGSVNVKFGGGMELQNLHNTALSILYNAERYPKDLALAAGIYLHNLLIHATDDLCKPIGGKND